MATFVLVHGGFHGGWCWKRLTPYLREAGHVVYTPTLTGLGERSHLASPQVNLSTHIQDIRNILMYEDLTDVILVGHSYRSCAPIWNYRRGRYTVGTRQNHTPANQYFYRTTPIN